MSLNKWSKHLQKYLFLLKDDFFELPYLSNSPEVMFNSVIKTPIAKHKPLEQAIYTNNPFCKGIMHYRQIEDGFWLLATDIEIKQNIIAKAIYTEDEVSDYYFLSFSAFEYEFPIKDSLNNNVTLLSVCWTFYKPRTEVATYFYKNTKGKFYNFIFNKKWADNNLFFKDLHNTESIYKLLNNDLGFYTWLDIAPKASTLAKQISKILENENSGVFNTVDLKKHSLDLITDFIKNAFNDNRMKNDVSLSNLDYYKIAKAEKMILHNLNVPFVGIEHIATEVNMSPTKLKSNFKTVFGLSLLQYHKEKNMRLALQLIQKTNDQVKVIITLTGYNSNSKFSSAFKKRFGFLPSETEKKIA